MYPKRCPNCNVPMSMLVSDNDSMWICLFCDYSESVSL